MSTDMTLHLALPRPGERPSRPQSHYVASSTGPTLEFADEQAEEERGDGSASNEEIDANAAASRTRRRRRRRTRHRGYRSEGEGDTTLLEARHRELNHMFGIIPWKNHVAHKPLEQHSQTVRELYEPPKKVRSSLEGHSLVSPGNVLWVALFGWWLALVYIIAWLFFTVLVFTRHYALLCWRLASYHFWPFGKYIVYADQPIAASEDASETLGLLTRRNADNSSAVSKPSGKGLDDCHLLPIGDKIALAVYLFVVSTVVLAAHMVVFVVCWMTVVTIPMAKVTLEAYKMLFRRPMAIEVVSSPVGHDVLLCTYQAINVHYYKYTVGGMNVVLVNLVPFVVFSLVLGYLVPEYYRPDSLVLFFFCLISAIPLSYYIGMAISSISAQSSLALGAVLNATFGSIVELILYCSAIAQGDLAVLVQSAITGTLLGLMLLLPGLSMIFGGFRHKSQQFNPTATGVSFTLLLVSIIGAFTPTIFYLAYGHYELSCENCVANGALAEVYNQTAAMRMVLATRSAFGGTVFLRKQSENVTSLFDVDCSQCAWVQSPLDKDPTYTEGSRPLMFFCAAILPIAYIVGLIFTLKTHKHIYDPPKASTSRQREYSELPSEETSEASTIGEHSMGGHGEGVPEWSKATCIVILVVATIMFALIAEELVNAVKPSLSRLGLSQAFIGMTLIGVVPNTAEYVNAIGFALQNNFALSIEIANAASVQVALIQVPVLVVFSAAYTGLKAAGSFTLIFPLLDVFAVVFALLILSYVSIEGRANYFTGTALVIIYALLLAAFYWVDAIRQRHEGWAL